MDNSRWTHLHCHTQYSLLDGIIKRSRLIERSKELGFGAVCVTEHGNLLNIVDFYLKCKKEDIKPIIGIEAYMIPPGDEKYNDHLLLIAKNRKGYNNLLALSSLSFNDGYKGGRGRIAYDYLSQHKDGIIVSTACLAGRVHRLIDNDDVDGAIKWLIAMRNDFGDNFFVELIDNGWSLQKMHNNIVYRMASDLRIPIIATNDVHYINREDAYIQDVALAIQTKQLVNNISSRKMSIYEAGNPVTDGYLKTIDEMKELGFPDAAYANVAHIIDMIEDYDIKLPDNPMMPVYYIGEAEAFTDTREILEDLCLSNWDKVPKDKEITYANRLSMELEVINKLGFTDYFLIIGDIIAYCKRNGILTGPGRGSASGSLVVYLLGITEVDPIRFGLYFERFLNPERISPPDIDFDVEQGRRQEVIQYIKDTYGIENVIQIGTFSRMAVKDTVRRVGKALGIELKTVHNLSKEINIDDGTKNHDMSDLLDKHPGVKAQMDALDPQWWKYSDALCNLPTGVGVHAAGLIISDRGLSEVPSCAAGSKAAGQKINMVSQFDMILLEKMGYTKFDLLGLKSLDVIHETIDLINKNGEIFPSIRSIYDERYIPLDDGDTYKLIGEGETTGVFQLENEGFKGLCRKLRPSTFDHIAALNALYRPGPIGSGVMDEFIERRHGRKPIVYDFDGMESITNYTFGLALYQEQLMRLSMEVAGYTLPQADHLRKIIGKKQVEKIAEEEESFLARGKAYGKFSEDDIRKAFEIIKPAGRYAWNLAHAVAYGYVTYVMAYFKAHYPAEFYTASLNTSLGDSDRVFTLIRDARESGITIKQPSINVSGRYFTSNMGEIVYGLQSIKGIGESVADAIISNRQQFGPFEGLVDFIKRVPSKTVTILHKKTLITAGAFDGSDPDFNFSRAAMFEAVGKFSDKRKGRKLARSTVEKGLKNCEANGDLLMAQEYMDALDRGPNDKGKYTVYDSIDDLTIEQIPEWDDMTIYRYEMDTLGLSLSVKISSMFEECIRWFNIQNVYDIEEAKAKPYGWKVSIAGVITRIHEIVAKNGKKMGFVELSDDKGRADVTIFSDEWALHDLKSGQSYIIQCRVDTNKDRTETQLIADKVLSINSVKVSFIKLDKIKYDIDRLKELGKYNHFEVMGSGSIIPMKGARYFILTYHISRFLDIFTDSSWKAEIL